MPSQFCSPDLPTLHGWTHRPKAQGGTDPIPGLGGSDLAWAYASAAFSGSPTAGSYVPRWSTLRTNTTGFVEGASISAGSAARIQLNEGGYYLIRAAVFLQSAGTLSTTRDNEFIVTFDDSGSSVRIQNGTGAADTAGMQWSDISNQRTGEVGGLALFESLTFNYNPDSQVSDLDFAAPLKLGVSLDTDPADTTSRDLGFEMWLLRVAATPGFGSDLIS